MEPAPDGSVDVAVAQVLRICANHGVTELLAALYWHTDPSVEAPLDELAGSLADTDMHAWVTEARTRQLSPIQQIVLLNSLLRRSRKSDQWVHYTIAHQLRLLQTAGLAEAHLPLALHSFLAVEGFPQNEGARSASHALLSASLARIAPRDGVRHGLLAGLCGNPRVFLHNHAALNQLDIAPPKDGLDHASADRINKEIGSPLSLGARMAMSQDLLAATHFTIEPEKEIVWQKPLGQSSHYLFAHAGQAVFRPALSVVRMENATFTADLSRPGLPQFYTAASGRYADDLCFGIRPFDPACQLACDLPLFVVEDSFSSKSNISHFLLDHIPRLLAYREVEKGRAATLLCEKLNYYREVFEALGVTDIVEPAARAFSISAPAIYFTSTMFRNFDHPANLGSPRTITALRAAFNVSEQARPTRRIAISRADASGRDMTNRNEMHAFLTDRGFEIITLSGRSFPQQMALFANASHIVAVHGAGLTNMVFAPRTCRVLEILPPFAAAHSYWALAAATGQTYFAFNADDPELPRPDYGKWTHNPGYNRRDVTVDMQSFVRAFDEFLTA